MIVKEDSKRKVLGLVFMLMLSTSSGFLGGWYGALSQSKNKFFANNNELQQQIVLNESQLISDIASRVGPSVVSVNVVSDSSNRFFFGPGSQLSAGTGFIISEDGLIITNRHVVPVEASKVSIVLSDGTELDDVSVVGRTGNSDPLDVAFLKVNDKKQKDLKPVKIGDSSKMKVGDKVVAIGNALGEFQNTVTAGIVSGFGRSVEAGDAFESELLVDLIQTDAAINQGNSGGPLVNMAGEVIAINTAIAGGAENIGFAIPINDVSGLIANVLKNGRLLRPYLGVRYLMLNDQIANQYGLEQKSGALVPPSQQGNPSVLAGSPAAKAGLMGWDIITKINEHDVNESNSLVSVVGRFQPGDKVTIIIIRDKKEIKLEVTLEEAR